MRHLKTFFFTGAPKKKKKKKENPQKAVALYSLKIWSTLKFQDEPKMDPVLEVHPEISLKSRIRLTFYE